MLLPLLLTIGVCVATPATATCPPASLAELVSASDRIVIGEVTAVSPGRVEEIELSPEGPRARLIYTLVTVTVSESLLGDAARELVVKVAGGRRGHTVTFVPDEPGFATGEQLLLFLGAEPTSAGGGHGLLSVAYGVQGKFLLKGDGQAREALRTEGIRSGLLGPEYAGGPIQLGQLRRSIQEALTHRAD